MASSNETEKRFIHAVKETGLKVTPGKPIRVEKPVKNRKGKLRKKVTVPDCIITDKKDRSKHIEITEGKGKNSHKRAQRRVVEAAGMSNDYVIIKGKDVRTIINEKHIEKRKSLILMLLGWILIL